MNTFRELDPFLRAAVRAGRMTEEQARDVDAIIDGLATRIRAGELTHEQVSVLEKQALAPYGVDRGRP